MEGQSALVGGHFSGAALLRWDVQTCAELTDHSAVGTVGVETAASVCALSPASTESLGGCLCFLCLAGERDSTPYRGLSQT